MILCRIPFFNLQLFIESHLIKFLFSKDHKLIHYIFRNKNILLYNFYLSLLAIFEILTKMYGVKYHYFQNCHHLLDLALKMSYHYQSSHKEK